SCSPLPAFHGVVDVRGHALAPLHSGIRPSRLLPLLPVFSGNGLSSRWVNCRQPFALNLRDCANGRFQVINLEKHDAAAAMSAAYDSGERARGQYGADGGVGVIGGLEPSRLNGGLLDLLPIIVSCDKYTVAIAKLDRKSVV